MKNHFLLSLLMLFPVVTGCRHNQVDNKIVDGLPLNTNRAVLPAAALQQLLLFKRDNIRVTVTAINKTSIANPTYPELTNVGGNVYQFQISEKHYGTATVRIQFFDASGVSIDPIANQSSTATFKTVTINTNGSSGMFTYTEAGAITLDTAGDVTSTMHSTGTFSFNGSGYSINSNILAPGARTSVDGFRDGTLTGAGTNLTSGAPVTMSIGLNNNQSANGSLAWDGEKGGVEFDNTGLGFVITSTTRIPIQ